MDFHEALSNKAEPVELTGGDSSYFSKPQLGLDPRLFRNNQIIPSVRNAVLSSLFGHLSYKYNAAESWSHVWLAGSGVSHQWAAEREPADLDCLIGINYEQFRIANSNYKGFSDKEIASMLNEGFRNELQQDTKNFLGSFELTFYVNVQSDITKIKPYAAYSLTEDDWTVEPTQQTAEHRKDWDLKVNRDRMMALDIISRYTQALNKLQAAQNDAMRVNAQREVFLAATQGTALFEDIHQNRKSAFSESGEGYADFANYRWQANKDSGVIPALKKLKELTDESKKATEVRMYGTELPGADVLIRRAMTRE